MDFFPGHICNYEISMSIAIFFLILNLRAALCAEKTTMLLFKVLISYSFLLKVDWKKNAAFFFQTCKFTLHILLFDLWT